MDVAQATAAVALEEWAEKDARGAVAPPRPDEAAIWSGDELHWEALVEVARELGPDPRLRDFDDAELTRQVRVQAAELAAATCHWIEHIAELVVRGVWAQQGARTPAQWLSWAVGLAASTARDHVRVGLRLRELPKIREGFAAGRLSYSKVRALTRVATPELEDMLLTWADAATAAMIESVIKGWRRSRRAVRAADAPESTRGLTHRITDDGTMQIVVRAPIEEGAQLLDALRWLADRAERATDGDDTDDTGAAGIDAADEVAEQPVEGPGTRPGQAGQLLDALLAAVVAATQGEVDTTGADRHTLVLHAPLADLLAANAPTAPADAGEEAAAASVGDDLDRLVPVAGANDRLPAMSVRVLRQLACDAGIVLIATDRAGSPIDVGRRHRQLTAALRRALRLRDRTCRFPGCSTRRHLHAHHIWHWADGGPTDLDNLVLLCGHHHRVVHRDGWAVERDGRGRFRFAPPGRTEMPPSLPMRGASAESVSDRVALLPDLAEMALHPGGWGGTPVDVDLAVSVLHQELSRLRPDLAVAA